MTKFVWMDHTTVACSTRRRHNITPRSETRLDYVFRERDERTSRVTQTSMLSRINKHRVCAVSVYEQASTSSPIFRKETNTVHSDQLVKIRVVCPRTNEICQLAWQYTIQSYENSHVSYTRNTYECIIIYECIYQAGATYRHR